MERVGDAVARELNRFGPVAGMGRLIDIWPGAVGVEIARNAWPARVARDGTLQVHAKDSIWAFELTSRAEEIRQRLGELAPPKLTFAPGPLLEHSPEPSEEPAKSSLKPSKEHVAKADSLTRGIRDPDLRKLVAKAVAASLAKGDNDRSFW